MLYEISIYSYVHNLCNTFSDGRVPNNFHSNYFYLHWDHLFMLYDKFAYRMEIRKKEGDCMNLEDFNKLFVYAILTRDLHYEAQKRLDRGLTDGELADLSDKLRNILNSHLAAIYNNIFRELEDKI